VISFEISGGTSALTAIAQRILEIEGVARVRIIPALRDGHSLVSGEVSQGATDALVDELSKLGVLRDELRLTRVEELGGGVAGAQDTSLIWTDVVGFAGSNARIIGRYLAFMAVAGVIACYGVIDTNPLLVVGAMAVSPDLLPITATAVGLIGRSFRLAGRAFLTLAVGMAVAVLFAAIFAFAQNELALLPSTFNIDNTVLHGLAHVDDETIVVALVAGIAGMLAFETRASAGVGVAISVTTIPAAAYLGVAAGLGEASKALGALAVLGTNVALMVTGAAITLTGQRALARRSRSGARSIRGSR
jgi:uncharacterized hydrophobic protein (TIGR00271 family)